MNIPLIGRQAPAINRGDLFSVGRMRQTLKSLATNPFSSNLKDAAASAATPAPSSSAPSTSSAPTVISPFNNGRQILDAGRQSSVIPSLPNSQSTPAAGAPQHWYADSPDDDAYWAAQPPAIQQLREIQDPDARKAAAIQLAQQGYTIDVPIMAWGWDAAKTIEMRKTFGYTWVPSALQQPVTAAPGITGPGITPYDPDHPPVGSIKV